MSPPETATRASSRADARGSSTWLSTKFAVTTSKEPLSKGSRGREPDTNVCDG